MSMICGNCNKIGIHWVGPYGNLTGTKCPHCGSAIALLLFTVWMLASAYSGQLTQ